MTGIDLDIENTASTPEMFASALRKLSTLHGQYRLLMAPETADVAPNIPVPPGKLDHLKLIKLVKDLVTIVNTQYYNSGSMFAFDGTLVQPSTVEFVVGLIGIGLLLVLPIY